ncbi:MAG TPA: hypothetical protein VGA08_03375 [Candidatus Saccharimonadales bacterium]
MERLPGEPKIYEFKEVQLGEFEIAGPGLSLVAESVDHSVIIVALDRRSKLKFLGNFAKVEENPVFQEFLNKLAANNNEKLHVAVSGGRRTPNLRLNEDDAVLLREEVIEALAHLNIVLPKANIRWNTWESELNLLEIQTVQVDDDTISIEDEQL